jgi:hypothetical protein
MMRGWKLMAATLLLAGCAGSPMAMPGSTGMPGPYPTPRAGGALGNLVGDALTQEENELRAVQKRPNEINFPVRLGVLFYDYQTNLKPEDQQAMITTIGNDLVATGLVKSTFQIPTSMLRGGDNLASLRKLSASFQLDALLIVSGSQSFQRAEAQPLGFFDAFTNRAYYEARTSLTAVAMNIYTGTFLSPFQAVGKDGPTLLDFDAADYAATSYAMRQRAETAAFNQLKAGLVTSLTSLKAVAVPPGSVASPTPSPTPSVEASPTPSPSPTAQ